MNAVQLLKEFAYWYENTMGDDLCGYDQDTIPYKVWEFLITNQSDIREYPHVDCFYSGGRGCNNIRLPSARARFGLKRDVSAEIALRRSGIGRGTKFAEIKVFTGRAEER